GVALFAGVSGVFGQVVIGTDSLTGRQQGKSQAGARSAQTAGDHDCGSRAAWSLAMMLTVAVRPAISVDGSGTESRLIRTGTRWARRTQSKAGVTLGSRSAPLLR